MALVIGTEQHRYLTFEHVACKLAETPAERWLDSDNVVARVNLPNMRSGARDRVEIYARAMNGLLALEKDDAKRAKYMEFIDIYASLTDNELRRYRRQHPEEGNIVTSFFQRAREEGIEQGFEQGFEQGTEQGIEQGTEQGLRQGRAEGGRAVLERLLQRRFGDLSPETAQWLRRVPEAELADWTDRLLDAATLDEVFGART